jgi:hypothetical protein
MKRFKLVVIAAVLCLMLGSAWLIRAQQTNRLLVMAGLRGRAFYSSVSRLDEK